MNLVPQNIIESQKYGMNHFDKNSFRPRAGSQFDPSSKPDCVNSIDRDQYENVLKTSSI